MKLDAAMLGHDDRFYLVYRESAGLEAESGEAGPSRHVGNLRTLKSCMYKYTDLIEKGCLLLHTSHSLSSRFTRSTQKRTERRVERKSECKRQVPPPLAIGIFRASRFSRNTSNVFDLI